LSLVILRSPYYLLPLNCFVANSPSRTPGFALEPVAHYDSLPIWALPLWRFASLHCHPNNVGKFFSHTLSRFEPDPEKSYRATRPTKPAALKLPE